MTLKEMRSLVRMALGNPNHEQVPDSEINHYLNEGQAKLNKDGLMLRKSATANIVADQERYSMPTDIVSVLRVDYDGKKETFKPITINIESTVQIVLSPNPAIEDIYLRSNEMLYGTTTITVINAIGKIMYEETFENKFNTLKIDLEDYTRGFYLLNIKNDQKNETLRFVKK